MNKEVGIARKVSKEQSEHENPTSCDPEGRSTGCQYSLLLEQVGEWTTVWDTGNEDDERAAALQLINETLKQAPQTLPRIVREDIDEGARAFQSKNCNP